MSRHLKNISVVSGLTVVSRFLGLLRESVSAAMFSTSKLMSAFVTGLQLPNLFRRMLAEGGLTAAFVPTLNDQLESRKREGAFELVNKVSSWLLVVTGSLVVLGMVVFSQNTAIRAVGGWVHAKPDVIERWVLAAHFTVILFPYLLCVSLAAVFSGALQSLHRFLEPALSPIWLNLSVIGLMVAAIDFAPDTQEVRIYWLAAGWLLGGVLQMIVPALALRKEGWRPCFDLTVTDPLRSMVRLMVPTLFSSSIYLINMTASRFIGLSLNDQANSVLNFAQRIMELPIGVFAVAVSTVVFPLIARYAAAGDRENLAAAYRKGMRLILLINIPAAVGMTILATPIVRTILEHGQFGPSDTALTVPVLVANALGLPFLSFANLALRAFYAQKDMIVPVKSALLSFVVNIGLSVVLMKPLSIIGLALASSVAGAVQAFYLQWHLARKHDGLAFHHLMGDLVKIIAAAVMMALPVWGVWWARVTFLAPSRTLDFVAMAAAVVVGIAVYGATAWVLRVEAREDAAALWTKLRSKVARS